jgi:hypothetical protein
MAANSRVNPNFPLPGLDQSSKGFRDNFTIIKQELEALQGKSIQITGDVSGGPTQLGSGQQVVQIVTVGKVYRQSFLTGDVGGGELIVTHGLGFTIVMVQVSDNLGQVIQPDLITLLNPTQIKLTLTSFMPLTGSWNVIVRG